MGKVHQIDVDEKELARMITETQTNRKAVTVQFGVGRTWIDWEEGTPIPWELELLAKLRGITTQGVDGDGI